MTEAPPSATPDRVARLLAELLGVPEVGPDDDFLELGGDSILVARLASRLDAVFGADIPLENLLSEPTAAAIAARLGDAVSEARPARPLMPVERHLQLPASILQECELLHDWCGDVVLLSWHLQGPLNRTALRETLTEIVRRHEAFRTSFEVVEGRVVQRIMSAQTPCFRQLDLRPLSAADQRETIAEMERRDSKKPFDLRGDVLLRATLVRLTEDEYHLLIATDHLVFDGWSRRVLSQELLALYDAFNGGGPSNLPDHPAQQVDCIAWLEQGLQGKELEHRLHYWRGRLRHTVPLPPLPLPGEQIEPPTPEHVGAVLGASELCAVRALARRQGLTLFMVVLGAVADAVGRSLGLSDVVVHSPSANRGHPAMEHAIGWFATSLIYRVRVDDEATLPDYLARVRSVAHDAQAYQLPLSLLVRELQPRVFDPGQPNPPRVFLGFQSGVAPPPQMVTATGLTLREAHPAAQPGPRPGLAFYAGLGPQGLGLSVVGPRRTGDGGLYKGLLERAIGFLNQLARASF